MITWITVWVLTVIIDIDTSERARATSYQLTYATKEICEKQRKNHIHSNSRTKCNFQQVPIYKDK